MRIVAVIGSMRNGNTEYMVDEVISSIEKIRNIEVIRIHLRDLKMEFCDGCLICDETGQCVKMDDMSKIVQTIELAGWFDFGITSTLEFIVWRNEDIL